MTSPSTSIRRTMAAVLAAGPLLLLAACGGSGGSESDDGSEALRVGVLMSTSGPAAPFGISERNGAVVVLNDINARGGINGEEIEIFEADDKSDPTEAAQQARKLITQDKVDVIIGTTAGGNTLAYAPIAAASKIPILTPNGTIAVTDKANDFWPWVFRAAPSDLVSAKAMLDQVVAEGSTDIALFAEETAYGDGTLAYLEDLIADDSSLSLVTTARAAVEATDFTAQATRITNESPDVVLLITSAPVVGSGITTAIRKTGSEVPIWGPIGLAQQGFIDGAGEAAEGVHMVAMNDWNNPSEGEQQLAALLEAEGFEGTSYEVAGSNAAQALEAAAKTITDGYSGEKIQAALENVCDLDTYAIGDGVCYTEDERDGYGTDSLTMLVVTDSKFATYTPN